MEVKPGYKLTEVGAIPEDWRMSKVGEVCGFIVPGRNKPKSFDGDIPWITTPDLEDGQTVSSSKLGLCISRKEAKSVGSKIVPPGSVLMSCAGELGIVALTQNEIVVNQQLHVFIPTEHIDGIFLLNALAYQKDQIASYGTKTAVPYLNKTSCNSIPIPLPSLPEQRSIATALSDMDALLVGLDRLIAKKRDLKQAAMQQLLTGKTRLPGFGEGKGYKETEVGIIPEDWDAKMFDDVLTGFSSGSTPSRSRPDFFKGKIVWITGGELNYRLIIDSEEKLTQEAVQRSNLRIYPPNTFVMGITGLEAEKTRGSCAITGIEAAMSQQCMALLPKPGFSVRYLFHYYVAFGKNLALEYCQGTKQQSYSSRIVKILPIAVPPTVEEQRSIATVLSDMDAEIATLEQRRDKTRALKQAMMQELLTGRTRLV